MPAGSPCSVLTLSSRTEALRDATAEGIADDAWRDGVPGLLREHTI